MSVDVICVLVYLFCSMLLGLPIANFWCVGIEFIEVKKSCSRGHRVIDVEIP